MSRLIDADALLQEFETENVARNSDIWHITGIKAFIENAPTGFDTEKVVEQLEEKTDFLKDCTKYGNKDAEQQEKSYSTMMMYEIADLVEELIDIVKKGGVE